MTEDTDTGLFNMDPLYVQDGIPVFCAYDEYLHNYDLISSDHLDALDAEGINPFMQADTVEELEVKTVAFALSHQPEIRRILDAGVGPGTFLSRIPAHEKHGVDISLGYLKRVKDMGIAPVLAKLEQLPYADNSFDMIVSTDVLEHVLDFLQSTLQLVRVLAEGGTLIVRVPYRENLSPYLDYDAYDLVHVRNFDLSTLRAHFEKVLGLEFLGSELLKPHWRGIQFSVFEDAIDRQLTEPELAALENLPVLSEVSKLIDALPAELNRQLLELKAVDADAYQRACHALSRHLEICVAFRKPEGHAFRASLSHLVDPSQIHTAAMSGPASETELVVNRLAAIEASLTSNRLARRLEKLEQQVASLHAASQSRHAASQSRLQAGIAALQQAHKLQSQIMLERLPEPPRSLRKRLTMRGLRRLLGL